MKVSAVTVYYNRRDRVDESIQSLLDQTYGDLEIIAVDDGSTDDTLAKLRSFRDPRLTVVSHANRGFTASIIEAVKRSAGEAIAVHGSGDISYPRRIERQAGMLIDRPDVGVVGCMVDNVNTVTGSSAVYHKLSEAEPALGQLLRGNVFTHGEVMFRRRVYDEAGGYRTLFKFSQDYDLWLRMARLTSFATVKEVLYRRYTLSDGVSASFDKQIVQKYLAELARQCIETKLAGGADPIDEHGAYGLFFRRRSGRLARVLLRLGVGALLDHHDAKQARRILELSLDERPNAAVAALAALIGLSGRSAALRSSLRFAMQAAKKLYGAGTDRLPEHGRELVR